MKRLIAIVSLCLVLIPVFTYAQGKTAQIEAVTVEQGKPFPLVTADNTNPCLYEAPSVLTDELTPLIVAQQKAIEPKSKRAGIKKVQLAPINWSAPMMRVSPPDREHKPPPLDQWVTIKRPPKKFQLSQRVIDKNIKVYKRAPLPFKPFEILDPATGRQIAPTTVLTLPNGEKITAEQYYTELNKLEKGFNDLGYSLDFRRDPTPRVILQQIVLDPAIVTQMTIQKRLLEDTHKFKTLPPPKSIDALQKEFRTDLTKDRIRLQQLQRFRQPQQIGVPQGTLEQLLLPQAYAAPEDQVKPYNKVIETPKYEYGYRDVFAVFFNGGTVLSGDSTKTAVNGVAEAGAYVFDNKLTMVRIAGDLSAPLGSGNMEARLTLTVLGETRLKINQSKPVPLNVDQLPQIPSLALYDRSSESLDESFESSFALGPILLSVKFGVRASAGVDYGLFLSPANANGRFGPFVGADLYAQAGLNIIIAKAGVSCTLVLLDNCLTLSGQLKADADQRGPYFSALFSIYDRFEALSGEVSLYACILVPKFALPPWGYKCWDWEIAKWEGLRAKGYIVKESSEKFYFLEGGAPEAEGPPATGGEEFGVEGEIAGRWMPQDRELTAQGAQSGFGPSSVVFGNRLYLFWQEGSSIKYTTYADTQFRSDAHYLTYYEIYTINGSPTAIPPAVVVFKDRLYVFHGAYGGTTKIWYRYMDRNGNWWPRNFSAEIDYTSTDKRPAVAVFNDSLYLFYKKPGGREIYYCWIHKDAVTSAADGSELLDWRNRTIRERQIPGSNTSAGPAVAVWKDRLFVFFKGETNKNIYYRFMAPDGYWMPPDRSKRVSGSTTTHTPALAVFKDRLHLVHKGASNKYIYHRIASPHEGRLDPLDWTKSGNTRDSTDDTPSLSVFNDKLIKFYKWPDGVKGMATRWYEEQ